jgi:hypothetical protein
MARDLNAEVTDAIGKAESAITQALHAWQKVAELEREIAQSDFSILELAIAARGTRSAETVVQVLRALDRQYED